MGLGQFGGGVAAARWLARQGAQVTVTDLADSSTLSQSLRSLRDEPIAQYHLGGHREDDFRTADLVVVNPAVRPGNPFVEIAVDAGATLTSELELLLQECPAHVIGVTGSNGKSTTAAMTAAILHADDQIVYLGGNIGHSLLDELHQMSEGQWAVVEISSFQLYYLGAAVRFPHVAAVSNCTPNHLDWHDTYANYVATKQRLLTGQRRNDLAILNTFDAEVADWTSLVRGRHVPLVGESLLPPLSVPGRHNRENALVAATVTMGIGCTEQAVQQGLAAYRGLPERLEWFAVIEGRRFYDDSSSTTPESTIAALQSLPEPSWLLAGGSDKGIDLHRLSETIVHRAAGAALYGAVREVLLEQIRSLSSSFPCDAVETIDEALAWCWRRSHAGENIVLSPGCASRDQFQNYRARGEHFVQLVHAQSDPRNR